MIKILIKSLKGFPQQGKKLYWASSRFEDMVKTNFAEASVPLLCKYRKEDLTATQ